MYLISYFWNSLCAPHSPPPQVYLICFHVGTLINKVDFTHSFYGTVSVSLRPLITKISPILSPKGPVIYSISIATDCTIHPNLPSTVSITGHRKEWIRQEERTEDEKSPSKHHAFPRSKEVASIQGQSSLLLTPSTDHQSIQIKYLNNFPKKKKNTSTSKNLQFHFKVSFAFIPQLRH